MGCLVTACEVSVGGRFFALFFSFLFFSAFFFSFLLFFFSFLLFFFFFALALALFSVRFRYFVGQMCFSSSSLGLAVLAWIGCFWWGGFFFLALTLSVCRSVGLSVSPPLDLLTSLFPRFCAFRFCAFRSGGVLEWASSSDCRGWRIAQLQNRSVAESECRRIGVLENWRIAESQDRRIAELENQRIAEFPWTTGRWSYVVVVVVGVG
jgi:hypothetical protein